MRAPLEEFKASGWRPTGFDIPEESNVFHRKVNNGQDGRWRTELQHYDRTKSERTLNSNHDPTRFTEGQSKSGSRKVEKGSLLHLFAGGVAGCASTLVTCPIDVIKTRQQSSADLGTTGARAATNACTHKHMTIPQSAFIRNAIRPHYTAAPPSIYNSPSSLIQHGRYILQIEGIRSFYKGLGPSLVGVVPSRAIFFYSYDYAKKKLHRDFGLHPNSWGTHVLASTTGGFLCCTATCPLWVLKTKQQLHRRLTKTSLSTIECIRKVWRTEGAKGFYRGLTASYAGIVETVIYFTIYEQLKALYVNKHNLDPSNADLSSISTLWELPGLMVISSLSKCTATCLAYPHEVVRTRLREEPVKQKYSGFFQTVRCISAKEGLRGLYGGLPAQLIRQVPNMAILMGVYEGVVYLVGH